VNGGPLVSVIVPVRNGADRLPRLVHRLSLQTLPRDSFEVIIADDGSTDRPAERLDIDGEWLRLTRGTPSNSYAARNRGVSLARGGSLAFTDADCLPCAEWLTSGLEELRSADLVAGHIELSLPIRPSPWAILDATLFDQQRFVAMGKAASANLFMTRALFDREGGFDASLPSGGDWEFVERSVREGARLAYARGTVVEHRVRSNACDFLARRWRIEHAAARRCTRSGVSLISFNTSREAVVPRRWGFVVGYDSRRLAALGLRDGWRTRLATAPARYAIVPAVDATAQATGWLRARGGPRTHRSELSVSVVIPTYQRRDCVVAAVRSALAQSHPAAEVIVVDDGSTDGTAEALSLLRDRVRYVRKENGGPASARNLGVRGAHGELVAFLDSDDRWRPNHLATVLAGYDRHPQATVVTTGPGFGLFGGLFTRPVGLIDALPRLLIGNFVGYPSCTVVRRGALLAAGGYDEELEATEPYDLLLRLALHGPFVLKRRRTVVRARRSDSRHDSSRQSGRSLAARERVGEKLAAELVTTSPSLAVAADSYRRFVAALRAFEDDDRAGAAVSLADACRLMPERSNEPWLVAGWLGLLPRSLTPEGRLEAFLWAADAWPAPASRTALGLRLHASVQAVRLRRVGVAVSLLADCARLARRSRHGATKGR
jgi:glycosyltransferase involved in cell wall biosynthesis